MTTLLPVDWQIESTAPDGYYAYAFGGGLPEPVRTDSYPTEVEALVALQAALRPLRRCPDRRLLNSRTAGGRELLTVLQ